MRRLIIAVAPDERYYQLIALMAKETFSANDFQ